MQYTFAKQRKDNKMKFEERRKRTFKYNEEVYVFSAFENGLPTIFKGRISGMLELENEPYKFFYYVETCLETRLGRNPDAIFKTIDEIRELIPALVVDQNGIYENDA